MTDRKPHKWMEVITAWAQGAVIQQRRWVGHPGMGEWGPWHLLKPEIAPMRTDMYCEYRVRPEPGKEPHKWQREKEAFLAGLHVQFRDATSKEGTWDGAWRKVEQYLVDHCNQTMCSEVEDVVPLWDRDWLEFRIKPADRVVEARVQLDEDGAWVVKRGITPNCRFTFKDGSLVAASVL